MNRRKIGANQEVLAAAYLKTQGYRILEMNYRCRYGEIDIIAQKGKLLVMVEVKYRSVDICGDPAEAVDARKQKKICSVALHYLMRHRYFQESPCRFDVMAMYGNGEITHIQDAFPFQY